METLISTYMCPFFMVFHLPLKQQVHDFPTRDTRKAVSAAASSKSKPCLKLELYDESVSPEQMGPVVSPEDSNGEVTIRYRTCGADMDDPLGLALATVDDGSIGVEVGMCLGRITGKHDSALYRVCFRDGEGSCVFVGGSSPRSASNTSDSTAGVPDDSVSMSHASVADGSIRTHPDP